MSISLMADDVEHLSTPVYHHIPFPAKRLFIAFIHFYSGSLVSLLLTHGRSLHILAASA